MTGAIAFDEEMLNRVSEISKVYKLINFIFQTDKVVEILIGSVSGID